MQTTEPKISKMGFLTAFMQPLRMGGPYRYFADDTDYKAHCAQYYESLSGYSEQSLRRAVRWINDNMEQYPLIPDVKKAIERTEPTSTTTSSTKAKSIYRWEAKRQEAKQMANEYVSRFMLNEDVARQARREGWQDKLELIVHNLAYIQAQVLCGCHISYQAGRLPLDYNQDIEKIDKYLERLLARVKKWAK